MTSVDDPELDTVILPVKNSRVALWNKTREGFKYLYDHHLEEYDFFMKADDDKLVLILNQKFLENICYQLR